MNKFSTLLVTASLLIAHNVSATDFSVYLPSSISLLIESRNVPEQREFWQQTPFYKSLSEVDWKVILQAIDSEDDDFDAEQFMGILSEVNNTWTQLQEQMSDSSVFAVSDISKVVELISEFDDMMDDEDDDDDDDDDEDDDDDDDDDEPMDEEDLLLMQSIFSTFYFMADVKDPQATNQLLIAAADRLLQTDDENDFARMSEDGIEGLEFVEEAESMGFGLYWTLEENILILGITKQAVLTQRGWIQSPPIDALSGNDDYILTRGRMLEDYDTLTYLPIGNIIKQIETFILEDDELENLAVVEKIFSWLEAEAMLPISYSFKNRASGMSSRSLVGFKNECGLQRLFMGPWGGVADKPSFAHKDFGTTSSASWSLTRFYELLEIELPKIAPEAAAGLGMGRMLAAGQLGFDFKLQLLDHLGDGIVTFQTIDPKVLNLISEAQAQQDFDEQARLAAEYPTQGQYYLIGLEVKNTDAVQSALNTLIAKVNPQGQTKTEAYRGVDITFPIPVAPGAAEMQNLITYAYLENYLLISIGQPNLLYMAIDASQNPDLQIWSTDEFTRLSDPFQFEPHALEYSSGEMMETRIEVLKKSFIAGLTSRVDEDTRAKITQELSKITFGIGGSLSVSQKTDLQIETNILQEIKP